jgi:hypothetical protein
MMSHPHNENIKPLKTHENKFNISSSYYKILMIKIALSSSTLVQFFNVENFN